MIFLSYHINIPIKNYYVCIIPLILFPIIKRIIALLMYYTNYLYDNELYQLLSII